METAVELSTEEIRSLLSKGWMTHDAMWFFAAYQDLGIEKANKLNLSAISLMAMIETKRILKAIGMENETFDSFEKIERFFEGARSTVIPEWMDFTWEKSGENSFRWQWHSCFAYDGIKRIGAIEKYRCGVMLRIQSWINVLGVKYEMTPEVDGCLMHQTGQCKGEFKFTF